MEEGRYAIWSELGKAANFTGGNGGNRGMTYPLITSLRQGSGWQARISADWMLENPRRSAKSAEESVVELDLRIETDSVLSVISCKIVRLPNC